jgi:hypothetical protein
MNSIEPEDYVQYSFTQPPASSQIHLIKIDKHDLDEVLTCLNVIESLSSSSMNPFDVNLDGWGELVQENISDYDEIFEELQEELSGFPIVSPAVRLLLQLGGSAAMVHMTNTMFKASMPAMDDVFQQHPELLKNFQNATMETMNKTSPAFTGFVNSHASGGGHQQPHQSQSRHQQPEYKQRPAQQTSYEEDPSIHDVMPRSNGSGLIFDSMNTTYEAPERSQKPNRPEMKGPGNIGDILSGLKTNTKTQSINIHDNSKKYNDTKDFNDSSTMSIEDLKQSQSAGIVPKRSNRRNKSSSNTVSIDL